MITLVVFQTAQLSSQIPAVFEQNYLKVLVLVKTLDTLLANPPQK
jgi:hypothetical protein